MSTSPSSPNPNPAGQNRAEASGDPIATSLNFEDRLRILWEKNSKLVVGLIGVVLLVILGQGAWEYFAEKKERDVRQAYAGASTTAQLKTFSDANPGHPLAAAAQLRIADEAYENGRYADAATAYDQAAGALKTGPLASRARLGSAIAKYQAGRTAEGEAALKAFANDANETKAYRAEALAHLASAASEAGNAADVRSYSDQLMQIDPASPWTQRTLQLLSTLPASEAPAQTEATTPANADSAPAITLPGAKK
jgi:hypothetical protein